MTTRTLLYKMLILAEGMQRVLNRRGVDVNFDDEEFAEVRKHLDTPEYAVPPSLLTAREVLSNRKISLIKLVRTATRDHAEQQWHRHRAALGYDPSEYPPQDARASVMGLKEAKELVEKFIDSDGRLD